MIRRRYDRHGLLALDPKAFFFLFDEPEQHDVEMRGDVAIINVRGPLDHHSGWWCDNYDAILDRVTSACASAAKTIVLRVDSPGGAVSGCFETARAIREKCAAASKGLVSYVDGQACSAAYALASAAPRIVLPPTAMVGSIGVIDTRLDVSTADAAMGLRFAFITSGARKADGNPHLALSAEELADRQTIVDSLAEVFFELVAEMRGIDASAVRALEARVLPGSAAVKEGLADEVMSFERLLASLAAAPAGAGMATKYEEARAALEDLAKGDDEEAKKAKKALKAMDEGDDDKEKDAEGDPPADDDKAKDDKAKDDKKDKSEAHASGIVSASTAADLASVVSALGRQVSELRAKNESSDRAAFLASRPDLDPSLRAVLANKPLAEVKEIVNAIPKPKAPKPAATATVPATRGEGQSDGPSVTVSDETAKMDAAMGITKYEMGSRREGNTIHFGVMPVKQAANDAGKDGAK